MHARLPRKAGGRPTGRKWVGQTVEPRKRRRKRAEGAVAASRRRSIGLRRGTDRTEKGPYYYVSECPRWDKTTLDRQKWSRVPRIFAQRSGPVRGVHKGSGTGSNWYS